MLVKRLQEHNDIIYASHNNEGFISFPNGDKKQGKRAADADWQGVFPIYMAIGYRSDERFEVLMQ